jgi:uncharacterized membrane protein
MDDVVLARVLHVLAAIVWIGGLAMVTTVVLPAIRRGEFGADPLHAFAAVERRFRLQVRTAIVIVGATGLYMTARLDLWSRFRSFEFWWMHAMVVLWLLFAFILFVAEPLFAERRFRRAAQAAPARAFARLQRGHWLLLALSLATAGGAVAGSHGWF